MAFSVNNGGNGSRRRRAGSNMMAEINVTPFVDVVLVLLIIFMLTAHVMDYGLQIDVPKVRAVDKSMEDLPIVSMDKSGNTFLGDKPIALHELKAAIQAQFGQVKAVYIRADGKAVWDGLAQLVEAVGTAGYQVNMVTQPLESTGKGKR